MNYVARSGPKLVDGPDPVPASAEQPGKVIELEGVSVRYGGGKSATTALDETTLDVRKGEFISFVGPSGCGKSTILRLVSGLVRPTSGVVVVGGREVGVKTLRIGMAFQNASMMPWLTVERNVMLPLKIVQPFRSEYRRKRKSEFRDRVRSLLAQVGLGGFANHFPWQLSGGMLQRANLCRALVHDPQLLLLDEPFGALDQFTREELWGTLQALWLDKRPTVPAGDARSARGRLSGVPDLRHEPASRADHRRYTGPVFISQNPCDDLRA
jgi:NitT/TauT family transport system ATP-binding protein